MNCEHTWKVTNGVLLTSLPPFYPMVCTTCGTRQHRVLESEADGQKIEVRTIPTRSAA